MFGSISSSAFSTQNTPEPTGRNSSAERTDENSPGLNISSFNPNCRALITHRLENPDESASPKMFSAPSNIEQVQDKKPETHLLASAMHAITLPFRIAGQICAASMRLLNPFSSRHIWSGEPHPQGHSPLKYRSLIHVGTTASVLSLSYMPRDYVPRLGASAATPRMDGPIEKGESPLLGEGTVAAHCDKIVEDLPKNGLTFEYMDRHYPGLVDKEKFSPTHTIAINSELPYDFVRSLILAQPKYQLTKGEVETKFPHVLESGDFQLAVDRGDKAFAPTFLLRCERERHNFPSSALIAQTERIFAETLDSNTFTSEMRRHPVFGPLIDDLLKGAAQNVTKNANQEGSVAADLFKQELFKRTKKYVSDHGTAPELMKRLDISLDEIDKKNPAK